MRRISSGLVLVLGCNGTKSLQQRAQEREFRGRLHHREILRCLRCDLAEAIAGDQRPTAMTPRELFGDAHHDPSIQDDTKRRRGVRDDLTLNLAEGHNVEL